MSGIGFWELIILFLIGLIVLGPERLPRVANQLGTWLGQARRMTRVMRRQLEDEIDLEKELQIKPDADKKKPSYSQPEYVSQNEDDDSYSPAHDKESVGTGVDDDDGYLADEAAAGEETGATEKAGKTDATEKAGEADATEKADQTGAADEGPELDGAVPAEPAKEKTA